MEIKAKNSRKRSRFLPSYIRNYVAFESLVYAFSNKLSDDYNGGQWKFREINNGGFYMRPDHDDKMSVEWTENYFSGVMTADAFGVTVCLYSLSYLANKTGGDRYIQMYNRLRDYALLHDEAKEILGAID